MGDVFSKFLISLGGVPASRKLIIVVLSGVALHFYGAGHEFMMGYIENSSLFLVGAITVEEFARKIKIGGKK